MSEIDLSKVRSFFDQTDLYLEKSFGIDTRARVVRDLLGKVSNSRILDAGCGNGAISLQYASSNNLITLIDISARMLELAKERIPPQADQHVQCLNMDFHEYSPDHPFDIVLCIGVLAHVQSIEQTIAKIANFLGQGGRCVIQFTDARSIASVVQRYYTTIYRNVIGDRYGYEANRTTYSDIVGISELNGLRLQDKRQYSLLLPGMARLPDRILYYFQLFTLRTPWLSRHGSEYLLLLVKE
jgi:ubiquinone/menaquinone biosynthesis C-methylase UbiE